MDFLKRYLDPKLDLVFKKIFADPNHSYLLISLLNDLLLFEGDQCIQELEYLPSEPLYDYLYGESSAIAVKCKDKTGRIFVVEMQMVWSFSSKQRVLFNTTGAYLSQFKRDKRAVFALDDHSLAERAKSFYGQIKMVYSLNILNSNYQDNNPEYYHRYTISEEGNYDEKIEGMEFIFVELPKFLNQPTATKQTKLRFNWLKMLCRSADNDPLPPDLQEDVLISEAFKLTEECGYTYVEKAIYERDWMEIWQYTAIVKSEAKAQAELKKAQVKAEEANNKLLKAALTLKQKGWKIEEIAEATGLSLYELGSR